MNKQLWWCWVVLIVASVALVACGGDDGGEEPVAGTSASGTGGGVGGASGASGASGMGGAGGGTMAAMPVPCGTNTCQPLGGGLAGMIPGLGANLPPPCCVDQAMGTCGTMTGGACMPPPMSDPRCPPLNFAGMMVPSCCTAAGICGVNASQLGFGCVDPGMFTGTMGMRCDGTTPDAGTDEDGGV